MKVLLVEDDLSGAEILKKALVSQHYLVEIAHNGQEGWNLASAMSYDLIILDLMLPKIDGVSLCKRLRAEGLRTPILLLTAQDSSNHKVIALDAGADDYVVKPFNREELLARIRALLRRGSTTTKPIIEFNSLRLDPSNCQVFYGKKLLHFTAKEYALIELFLRNNQRIFSQSALLDHLWSLEELPTENTVRAHIKSLRAKLKKSGASPDLIETVYGLGYRLNSKESQLYSANNQISNEAEPEKNSRISPASMQKVSAQLVNVWERVKNQYRDRIIVVEQAIIALQEGKLTETLQNQAVMQAHTLKGSLGSFGFEQASCSFDQIEQLLKTTEKLTSTQLEYLQKLIATSHQQLQEHLTTLPQPIPQSTGIDRETKLLIVDDDAALTEELAITSKAWGMRPIVANKLATAREIINQQQPDVVLLDLSFPDSTEAGFKLLAELSNYQPPIPVLVFTAHQSFADRVKVAKLGGKGFLQKPVFPAQVMEAIAQVLQQSSTLEAKLVIVDDDPQLLNYLYTLLAPWGFQIILLDDPREFWETLEQSNPDLIILDVAMPYISGIELCQVVRNDIRWSNLPILFLSAHTDEQTIEQVFVAGADDYVNKPIRAVELIARILNRLERTQRLRQLAEIDPLTKLSNRRKSFQDLTRLLHLSTRQNQPLSFAVIDLDHFKQVNDQHGHEMGDKVLSWFGKILKHSFRNEDVVARWGGEEFIIGLYGSTKEQSVDKLTELLNIVNQKEFVDENQTKFHVTFSAGVTEYSEQEFDIQAMYRVADAALYQAKAKGRNQIFTPS
ncbi:MAG: response regulator [Crinalium sp.]